MAHVVLGIGYHPCEYETVRDEWRQHDVDFHFERTVEQAVCRLRNTDYVCVTICTGHVDSDQLELLRSIRPVPVVVLSPECSVSERAKYFQLGAKDFLINMHQRQTTRSSDKDSVQYYLDDPAKGTEPLTIITTKDIYFCLEFRSVEVRGQRINLTAKEFDLLSLLITHPKRVFTFEYIIDEVWGEEYAPSSQKTLKNHIHNMRNKLKIQPDVPNHIISIHGVGFKYDPGQWDE